MFFGNVFMFLLCLSWLCIGFAMAGNAHSAYNFRNPFVYIGFVLLGWAGVITYLILYVYVKENKYPRPRRSGELAGTAKELLGKYK